MNLSLYIAKRYAISFSKNKAINIITGIASVGIIASTMALFVFLSVFSGLKEFTLDFANATDPEYKVETTTGKFFTLTKAQETKLRNSPSIAAFSKIASERVYFVYDEKEIVAEIKGVDSQFAAVTDFNQHLYVGEWLAPNSQEVVVGAEISRKLALGLYDYNHQLEVFAPKPGKGSIENPEEVFNKSLLFPSGVYSVNEEMDAKYIFCDLALAQHLLGLPPNYLTALEIKAAPQHSEEEIRNTLQSVLGSGIKIKNRAQLNDALYKMLQSENVFIYLFSTLVVILALFCLAGAIVMIIIDKRDHLKTLLHIGLTPKAIRGIFFAQGLLITFFGLCVGLALAALLILAQQHFSVIMITTSMPYPVLFEWKNVAIVVTTIVLLGMLSSWIASGTVTKNVLK